MTASSIRSLINADRYRGTEMSTVSRCDDLIKDAKQVLSSSARVSVPTYKRVTGLWGRMKVALSGATAKRERACARLNTFMVPYKHQFKEYDQWRKTASDIAFKKFTAVYNSSNRDNQELMLEMLADHVKIKVNDYITYGILKKK